MLYAQKMVDCVHASVAIGLTMPLVGQVGLLERENASILNASILSFARRTVSAYRDVLHRLDIDCPLYLTQVGFQSSLAQIY